jgi:hypothetical protein
MKYLLTWLGAALLFASSAVRADVDEADKRVIAAAEAAAHSVPLDAAAQSMKTDVWPHHYDLLLRYDKPVDAERDARAVFDAFVAHLAKARIDPAGEIAINICSVDTGADATVEHPHRLGCLHYNPFNAQLTYERT